MLPFFSLLKFFLSPSHLCFIMFLIFPHFLVLSFCFHSSFNFFCSFLCVHTRVYVCMLHACALCHKSTLRRLWHLGVFWVWWNGPLKNLHSPLVKELLYPQTVRGWFSTPGANFVAFSCPSLREKWISLICYLRSSQNKTKWNRRLVAWCACVPIIK